MPTVTTAPPDDLTRLKLRSLDAESAADEICAELPTGEQIVFAHRAGFALVTDEQYDRAHAALSRHARLEALIAHHEWTRAQPSAEDADRALAEAACASLDATIGA